ncbi:MAG TPA: CGNR zinc finger domain-containing protein [Dehalococcoidia bacterium]|nr:CGNR zinc finger domain-containing protein [Dehalococcoidia bacterium]
MGTHPYAPGELELVRAFVNTLDVEGGTDEFSTLEGLNAFYVEKGLLEDGVAGENDRVAAVTVREALRAFLKANHGEPADPEAVRALNEAFKSLPLTLRVAPDGSLALEPSQGGAGGALARIVAIVFRAMAEGTWSRLKICKSDSCQWAFYDYSRNRSGNWCSMAVCGNRTKVRRFQARARARGPGAAAARQT